MASDDAHSHILKEFPATSQSWWTDSNVEGCQSNTIAKHPISSDPAMAILAGHHGGKVYILVLDVLDVLGVWGVLGHFLTDSGAQEAGRLSSDWVADSRTFDSS